MCSSDLMLRQRLGQIGGKYSALHIRNTDHQTDYEHWIVRNAAVIQGPIFVATDNRDVVADCKSAFGAGRVHSFATLPSEAGRPLHRMPDLGDVYVRNVDAILDLLLLALSENLYVFELKPNRLGAKYSGFSVLASNLKGSRPILERLISALA